MRDWNASKLLQSSGMYWESCAIQAAVALGLFSSLAEKSLTEKEMAADLKCDERGLGMLLTAMAGLELIVRREGHCDLTPFSRQYLCRESPDYLGHMIEHHRHLVSSWARLDEAVRSGSPVHDRIADMPDGAVERESFLMGMCNIANAQAARSVPHIKLEGRLRLLDLGGATGIYAVHFCRANPGMTAVVFDLPTTRPFAEKMISEQGMADRISFLGGDFTRSSLPGGFDVVWLSQILHSFGPAQAKAVVEKAARALNPGGLLLIQEFVLDSDRTGPLHPALFSLNMLTRTADGQAYTEDELAGMLISSGACDVHRLPLDLPQGCAVISGLMRKI